ncbi:MAG TPA: hypothetical protein VGQ62_15220 [Chloroflexota bacterium]|jgi:hypothetical protein|nr:hypothetical protein [Chloroflexota bacterium]
MYAAERLEEVVSLCDTRVRSAITEYGIELRSFASLGAGTTPHRPAALFSSRA